MNGSDLTWGLYSELKGAFHWGTNLLCWSGNKESIDQSSIGKKGKFSRNRGREQLYLMKAGQKVGLYFLGAK